MPYNRRYSLDEVHQILCESERRERPSGGRELGHPITRHADGRRDILDGRHRSVIFLFATLEENRASGPIPNGSLAPRRPVGRDSRFVSRIGLIRAVFQALNSPAGQIELARLASERSITFATPLDRSLGIRAEAAGNPTADRSGTTASRRRPSLRQGTALGVFVLVDRVAKRDPACAIHIHTAYPTEVG